jgi:peroxiredoxin
VPVGRLAADVQDFPYIKNKDLFGRERKMKNRATFFSALGVTLAILSTALAQPPARERPGRGQTPARSEASEAAGERPGAEQRQQYQRLRQQIDELKAAHQSLTTQLRAIHEAAVKEKATETAAQVQALIHARQKTFESTLRDLEQQQARFQRAGRERGQRLGRVRGQSAGKQAPEFQANSFDGKAIKLSDYQDRVVVLEWVNPECPFSRYHYETVHTMAELAQKYKDKGVVWLAVNSTNHTTPQANREFAQKHKLPYPILDDRSGEVGRKYGARNTPHMFVIDKGTIVYEGAIDNAPLGKTEAGAGKVNYVDKALAEVLASQPVSVANTPPYGCTVKYAAAQ